MESPIDYWKREIEEGKLDIEFLGNILKTCSENDRERFKSILSNVIHAQIRDQRALEILEGRRKISDLIQWLSEFNYNIRARIYINDSIVFAGILGELLEQTSEYGIRAISKILETRGSFEKPYIDDNDLVVNIVTES